MSVQIGLAIDRATLDERIAARVEAMGRQLRRRGATAGSGRPRGRASTASRALGISTGIAFPLDGEISEAQARELTITATRKFARRQDSWFRKDQPDFLGCPTTILSSSPRRTSSADAPEPTQ
jgi:tRNA dimethylallyltransferase